MSVPKCIYFSVPGVPEDRRRDPLQRTKRPFGGAIADIKERYPHYLSDIKDGLNLQCLSAFFFIYFAALSPAITFGGLLSKFRKNNLQLDALVWGLIASEYSVM